MIPCLLTALQTLPVQAVDMEIRMKFEGNGARALPRSELLIETYWLRCLIMAKQ